MLNGHVCASSWNVHWDLWPISYWVFLFFDIELLELSVCFGDEFFVGIFVLKYIYIFYSECCLFLSLRVSFAVKMLLRLIMSLWPTFKLFIVTVKMWIQKELAVIYNKAFSAYIFLKGFRVSILTLRSVNYLEFIFVYGVTEWEMDYFLLYK